MRRPLVAMRVVTAVLALGAASVTLAQSDEATVRLGGLPVIAVGATPDETASERAARIQRRLERLADRPADGVSPIVARGADGTRIVSVLDVPLVTVTTADAEEQVTTVDALAAAWAEAIGMALDRTRASRLSGWRRFTDELRGSVTTAFARLLESATRIVPRALAALTVLGLFWALAATVRAGLRLAFRRVISDLTVENLLKQVSYYAVWGVGLLVAADALGFDPETVVTGLGLTGLALGFALKDIISNFVSGLLILALRPFQIGDEIGVGPTEGTVERIQLRATEIRTYDGRLVLVPNAEVFTSRVTNNTAAPVRRASLDVPLGYGSDMAAAMRALLQAAAAEPAVLAEPSPSVRVCDLGASGMHLELRFWTDSRRADMLATTSDVRRRVVAAFVEAGVPLPEPDVRRVLVSNAPPPVAADPDRVSDTL